MSLLAPISYDGRLKLTPHLKSAAISIRGKTAPNTPFELEYSPGLQSVQEELPAARPRARSAAVYHRPRTISPGHTMTMCGARAICDSE